MSESQVSKIHKTVDQVRELVKERIRSVPQELTELEFARHVATDTFELIDPSQVTIDLAQQMLEAQEKSWHNDYVLTDKYDSMKESEELKVVITSLSNPNPEDAIEYFSDLAKRKAKSAERYKSYFVEGGIPADKDVWLGLVTGAIREEKIDTSAAKNYETVVRLLENKVKLPVPNPQIGTMTLE